MKSKITPPIAPFLSKEAEAKRAVATFEAAVLRALSSDAAVSSTGVKGSKPSERDSQAQG
jgi:hypothetical protein